MHGGTQELDVTRSYNRIIMSWLCLVDPFTQMTARKRWIGLSSRGR